MVKSLCRSNAQKLCFAPVSQHLYTGLVHIQKLTAFIGGINHVMAAFEYAAVFLLPSDDLFLQTFQFRDILKYLNAPGNASGRILKNRSRTNYRNFLAIDIGNFKFPIMNIYTLCYRSFQCTIRFANRAFENILAEHSHRIFG